MEYHIWRHLIQILSFRNDLIETIKPFFEQLTNNNNQETFTFNEEEKHTPFLRSLDKFQLKILHEYGIIDGELYGNIVPKQEDLSTNPSIIQKRLWNH